jgi:hypothetical protein
MGGRPEEGEERARRSEASWIWGLLVMTGFVPSRPRS